MAAGRSLLDFAVAKAANWLFNGVGVAPPPAVAANEDEDDVGGRATGVAMTEVVTGDATRGTVAAAFDFPLLVVFFKGGSSSTVGNCGSLFVDFLFEPTFKEYRKRSTSALEIIS